jgi:cell division protein FtsW
MLLPFVPGIGSTINDASSWVSLGSLSFQPSEFFKMAVLVYCADLLTRREREIGDLRRTLVPCLMVAALGSGLCLLQGDLGSAIVLTAMVFVIAFVGGSPLTPLVSSLLVSAVAFGSCSRASAGSTGSRRSTSRTTASPELPGPQAQIAIAQAA